MEAAWLSPDVLSQVRSGTLLPRQEASHVISDLFDGH
jgi:RHH-type rel operon transcriptional repressor/antitoxin RelB